ncbi:hypothetical protein V8E55_006522, partial [Tylopilus felleus]
SASVHVHFDGPFDEVVTLPKVVPCFNHINSCKDHGWRIYTTVSDIDTNGVTLTIDMVRYLYSTPHRLAGSLQVIIQRIATMDVRPWGKPQLQQSAQISFGGVEFCETPAVFVGLNWMDIDHKDNLRLKTSLDNVTSRVLA